MEAFSYSKPHPLDLAADTGNDEETVYKKVISLHFIHSAKN